MAFTFYPIGEFPASAWPNGTLICPSSGVDADCQGDKYEACLLQVECGGLSCEDPGKQLALADFIDCFEGKNGSRIESAAGCADAAGLDADAVAACVSDPTASQAAFDAVQTLSADGMKSAACLPWIVIDGAVASLDPAHGCYGKDAGTAPLLDDLCAAASAQGLPLPESCL